MNSSSTWFSELVKTWPREKLLAAAVLKQRGVDLEALFRSATVTQSSIPFCPQEPKEKQRAFLDLTCEEALFGGSAGPGKAGRCPDRAAPWYDISMETTVLTPKGFVLIGDIKVGQQVCNPDGTLCRVIAIHDRGLQEFYRVTLDDGATVEASADHLWLVSVAGRRKRRRKEVPTVGADLRPEDEWNLRAYSRCTVVTTKQLAAMVERADHERERGMRVFAPQLPLTAPVSMTGAPGRWPFLPPYTLGVLLGDGSLHERNVCFASADPEIAHFVSQELGKTLKVRAIDKGDRCPVYSVTGAVGQKADSPQTLLRRDHLLGARSWEKFVPERIKLAPVEVRLAFVQGLMDTDGSIDEGGYLDFVTVSETLALDLQWLLRSLGYKATLSTKQPTYSYKGEKLEGRLAYRLYIRGPHQECLFRLPRKIDRARGFNGGDVWPSHRVEKVEPTGTDRARCITVDHPNGLYVTDNFIVTHNSSALLMAALQYVEVPSYAALLLRRTYADLSLPGALMDRLGEWLRPTAARWNNTEKTWVFPSGATITFGYLETEVSKFRYQGAEFQFCVAEGTAIRMADGTTQPIESIQPGDWVATLQGPRPVTALSPRHWKYCYQLTAAGSSTIVSEQHRILTESGWVCPRERLPRESHGAGRGFAALRVRAEGSYWPHEFPSADQRRGPSLSLPPVQETERRANAVCLAVHQSDFGASDDSLPAMPPPQAWSARAVLFAPATQSGEPGSAVDCARREAGRVPGENEPQDSKPDCHVGSRCDDVPLHPQSASARVGIPLRADAAGDSAENREYMDDPGYIPSHSRLPRWRYSHPYTSLPEVSVESVLLAPVCMAPVGVAAVRDLTVAGASHYVTSTGIISQNCGFDELSQFSEGQYRYLFSRLRRMEGSTVPMRMRAATNPGAEWVKNRFEIDMSREELVQWTADGERAFIPARLSDNDSLDAVAYVRSLDKLDPITRKQLLEGDWDVRPEGALFKREWFEIVKAGPA